MPHAEEALKHTGRELTIRIRRIRQMIRERTRRLNQEAKAQAVATEQLHSDLRLAAERRLSGTPASPANGSQA